jgi:alpha-beta hydrolase superfamily lysophospholipase
MSTPRPLVRRLVRWILLAILAFGVIVVLIATGWGVLSRDMPQLQPWHVRAPRSEVAAGDLDDRATLASYLQREDAAMREVREEIEPRTPQQLQGPFNRYAPGSATNPRSFAHDWNRTFEVEPSTIRGGALLIHGMTDSPYSMRSVARILQESGYYGLALRMPGHGTVPAGLARASWEDWAAAVRMGVRHVRQKIGPGKPLVLVGYSNGGALAVLYTLQALEDDTLPKPDRLVLLSPMIGVTPAAALAPVVSLFSGIPWFDRAAWTGIQPEYNPFKYNSFPANAGYQSHRLTRELDRAITRVQERGRLSAFPPVLTFQSIVDSTVVTGAVVDRLYDRMPSNGSALVMFDLNRFSPAHALMRGDVDGLFSRLFGGTARNYRVTAVTNTSSGVTDVVARDVEPGTTTTHDTPLGLKWPPMIFSLSHVAMPFPVDDPLYGITPDERENYGVRLGRVDPRGERGVLLVSVDDLMRLTSNPFFPYLEERLRAWVTQ